ncbi:MAG TPA: SRPBCC domain-containing protein [Gemmatimonadales bacterium]
MSTDTTTTLRLSRVIAADRARVFAAWTTAADMERWAAPEMASMLGVEVDLTVGGRYTIRMRGEEGQSYTAVGQYREIDPPRKVVYTWDWEEEANQVGETLVTVEFNDMNGSTEVVLTHELFPNAEAKGAHEQGWRSCLNRFEALFA